MVVLDYVLKALYPPPASSDSDSSSKPSPAAAVWDLASQLPTLSQASPSRR